MSDCPTCGGTGWVSPNYKRGDCYNCDDFQAQLAQRDAVIERLNAKIKEMEDDEADRAGEAKWEGH